MYVIAGIATPGICRIPAGDRFLVATPVTGEPRDAIRALRAENIEEARERIKALRSNVTRHRDVRCLNVAGPRSAMTGVG